MQSFRVPVPLLLLVATSVSLGDDWPQWRGASRTGTVADSPPLIDSVSSNQLPLAWEAPLPQGTYGRPYYSSPIATKGRAYLHISPGCEPAPPPPAAPSAVKPKPKKTDDLDDVLSGGAGKGGDEEAVSDIEKAAAKDVAAAAATKAKAAEVSAQKKSNETEDMLFCFDLANGREVWRFRKPGGPTGLGAPNTPCVADGKVIGNNRGKILVLNAKSGKTLISAATQVADCTSCALADGKLLANGGSHLRCYNLGRP